MTFWNDFEKQLRTEAGQIQQDLKKRNEKFAIQEIDALTRTLEQFAAAPPWVTAGETEADIKLALAMIREMIGTFQSDFKGTFIPADKRSRFYKAHGAFESRAAALIGPNKLGAI